MIWNTFISLLHLIALWLSHAIPFASIIALSASLSTAIHSFARQNAIFMYLVRRMYLGNFIDDKTINIYTWQTIRQYRRGTFRDERMERKMKENKTRMVLQHCSSSLFHIWNEIGPYSSLLIAFHITNSFLCISVVLVTSTLTDKWILVSYFSSYVNQSMYVESLERYRVLPS